MREKRHRWFRGNWVWFYPALLCSEWLSSVPSEKTAPMYLHFMSQHPQLSLSLSHTHTTLRLIPSRMRERLPISLNYIISQVPVLAHTTPRTIRQKIVFKALVEFLRYIYALNDFARYSKSTLMDSWMDHANATLINRSREGGGGAKRWTFSFKCKCVAIWTFHVMIVARNTLQNLLNYCKKTFLTPIPIQKVIP